MRGVPWITTSESTAAKLWGGRGFPVEEKSDPPGERI